MLTDALIFESRDTEIFVIPDTKTKLNTLQNYFFPRLQKLIDLSVSKTREVYKIDPLEKYSIVYSPAHRKDAKINKDTDSVHIGLSGRRDKNRQLKIKRPDGNPYAFHPARIVFEVSKTGKMSVFVSPFIYYDENYFNAVKSHFIENYDRFSALLNAGGLSYASFNDDFEMVSINRMLRDDFFFQVESPSFFLPIENPEVINRLVFYFVLMFPILDVCHSLAEGTKPIFSEHIDSLTQWLNTRDLPELKEVPAPEFQIPELDSYTFVRAGLWYQVLARDNWTCCSCRRSTNEHSIVLHVDHILPRSLGGKDEITNLQTLCLKCNLGKSNKDWTDLRIQT